MNPIGKEVGELMLAVWAVQQVVELLKLSVCTKEVSAIVRQDFCWFATSSNKSSEYCQEGCSR